MSSLEAGLEDVSFTILVTGFEPFGGETCNPSSEVLTHLPARVGLARVISAALPVQFARSQEILFGLIEEHQPHYLLMLGEAGGRSKISLERVALNWMDARIPDHAGFQPSGEPIFPDTENALFSTLPLEDMCVTLERENIPVEYSLTAGSYVCNALFFVALDGISDFEPDSIAPKAGFIHLPYLPQQVMDKPQHPYLELSVMVSALLHCLEVCVQNFAQNFKQDFQ